MNFKEKAKAEWEEKKKFWLEQHKEEKEGRAKVLKKLIKTHLEVDVEVCDTTVEIDGITFGFKKPPDNYLSMHTKCDKCGFSEWERVSCLSDVGRYIEMMEEHKCPDKDVQQEKPPEERLAEAVKEIMVRDSKVHINI